ncbi:AraC family transcriptional regulator [Aquabacterium sp. A7-Y]|uniref:helix-turn-helix transcriptional regulator n=1 Tax=Aquabacterium sp. A7-Y TaxID=1349605 RepID=UPI00223CFC3D|nr:AraC family transcriptional regulator [Aquabacterium sp. A7-Y]MCW7536825.1 AraC family transcriptional regulator [Aquabacterium sp. A7-Y]
MEPPALFQASNPIPRVLPTALAVHPGLAAHAARVLELLPGLRVHADDWVDPIDATVQGQCAPGLHLVFLLEGGLDVSYGLRRVMLTTAAASERARPARGSSAARCVMVNVNEPELFTRRVRQGGYARRVSLCVSHDWLRTLSAASGTRMPAALDALLTSHLALHSWQPSARAIALAEQLVRPPSYAPMLDRLYQTSCLLDLLAEALAPLQTGAPVSEPAALSTTLARRLRDLREFLNSEAADGLSLDEIARHAGMNVSALQNQFRRAYGTTVFSFVRESRLQRARAALERDGISIKRAATLAGYGSAANFATAFGRRFGITPNEARRAARR